MSEIRHAVGCGIVHLVYRHQNFGAGSYSVPKNLCLAHILYLSICYDSHNKQRSFPEKPRWLLSQYHRQCFLDVRNELLHVTHVTTFMFEKLAPVNKKSKCYSSQCSCWFPNELRFLEGSQLPPACPSSKSSLKSGGEFYCPSAAMPTTNLHWPGIKPGSLRWQKGLAAWPIVRPSTKWLAWNAFRIVFVQRSKHTLLRL